MIERMEREELELIQRLQNTQMLQKAAYDDLESALAGGQGSVMEGGQSTTSGRPGTASNRMGAGQKPGSKMGPRK